MSAKIVDLIARQVERSKAEQRATGSATRARKGSPLDVALCADPDVALAIDGDYIVQRLRALTPGQRDYLDGLTRLGALMHYGRCTEAQQLAVLHKLLRGIDAGEAPPIPNL